MNQNQPSENGCKLASAPIFDLDPESIGQALLRLGAISSQLGHSTVRGTIIPYCNHPELISPEGRFIVDMFSLPVSEIADRWYGGELEAAHLAGEIATSAFEPDGLPDES